MMLRFFTCDGWKNERKKTISRWSMYNFSMYVAISFDAIQSRHNVLVTGYDITGWQAIDKKWKIECWPCN